MMKIKSKLFYIPLITLSLISCNNAFDGDVSFSLSSSSESSSQTSSKEKLNIQKISGVLGNSFANALNTDKAKIEDDTYLSYEEGLKNKETGDNVLVQSLETLSRSITSFKNFNSNLSSTFALSYSLPSVSLAYEYEDYINDVSELIPEAEFYGLDAYIYTGYLYINTSESFVRKILPYILLNSNSYQTLDEAKDAVNEVPAKAKIEPKIISTATWTLFHELIEDYDADYLTNQFKDTFESWEDLEDRISFVEHDNRSYSISLEIPKEDIVNMVSDMYAIQEELGIEDGLSQEDFEKIKQDLQKNMTINSFKFTAEINNSYMFTSFGEDIDVVIKSLTTYEDVECNRTLGIIYNSTSNISYSGVEVNIPNDLSTYEVVNLEGLFKVEEE